MCVFVSDPDDRRDSMRGSKRGEEGVGEGGR